MICALCVGTSGDPNGGFTDKELSIVFKTVLPLCQTCMDTSEMYVVRKTFKTNGKQKL